MTDQLTAAQQDTIVRNIPLVEHIVNRLMQRFPATHDRDDLVQIGIMGLIEAATRFDPAHGVAFSTFGGRRIEGSILDHLRRNDWAPRSVRAAERQLHHAETELTARGGARPDAQQLASALGIDAAQIHQLRSRIATAAIDSIDRPTLQDDGATSLSDTLADHGAAGVESALDERELHAYLREAIALLPERHRLVIVGHFLEGRTMTELGQFLGVTQSRASQLKEDALRLMRQGLQAQYHDAELDPVIPRRTAREHEYTEKLSAAWWRRRRSDSRILV